MQPIPARIFELPLDTPDALTKFYGPPCREASLGWFQCPPEFRYDGQLLIRHRIHHSLVERFEGALAAIAERLGPQRWLTEGVGEWGGAYNPRASRGNKSRFSTHAWGIASDHAPGRNRFRVNETSFSELVFDTFEQFGFLSAWRAWGHDAMHFQAAKFSSLAPSSYYARLGYPVWIKR